MPVTVSFARTPIRKVCAYQHANDGYQGDDLDDSPEGEKQASEHLDCVLQVERSIAI